MSGEQLFPNVDSAPQLIILEHTSLAEEKFSKNGVHKNVHVVVKNTPFHITVGVKNTLSSNLNFNNITAEALLMYDCEGDRFVDFVNIKPIEYKGNINGNSDKMILEIRLKKLSSHLEDMFFKIRIKGVDNNTKEDIPYLFTTSQPIKVVSKPEQVTRIKQLQSGKKLPPKTTRKRKRSVNDMMYESIQNIEKQQEEQKEILRKILEKNNSSTCSTDDNNNTTTTQKKGVSTDLEEALNNLLYAYENTNPIERPLKIRKVARNSSVSNTSSIIEILSHLQSCLQGNNSSNQNVSNLPFSSDNLMQTKSSDLSLHDCDLERIDEFYRELLLPNSF